MVENAVTVFEKPILQGASLVVGWTPDAGRVGDRCIQYLKEKLGFRLFAEIEPLGYFALAGVTVERNVARSPVSEFYYHPDRDLILFFSDLPGSEWYRFLSLVLDTAASHGAREVLTLGGMLSVRAHTTPREMYSVLNTARLGEEFGRYEFASTFDYETPEGQRPTLSSFLLWVAKRRGIRGAGIWASVPYYLASFDDPRAAKKVLAFLDDRFHLGLDFTDLDIYIRRQHSRLAKARSSSGEINRCMERMEANLVLSDEEYEALSEAVDEYLQDFD